MEAFYVGAESLEFFDDTFAAPAGAVATIVEALSFVTGRSASASAALVDRFPLAIPLTVDRVIPRLVIRR
jgi:hypothetical protein